MDIEQEIEKRAKELIKARRKFDSDHDQKGFLSKLI